MSGRLVLLRHGQSFGNVERRLDTRPPGSELTDLGREQAKTFARAGAHPPGMVVHSVALRAAQTAAEISSALRLPARQLAGIHEVQAGELENRNDDDAVAEFNAVYRRWHRGEPGVALPGGESAADVLSRYLPVLTELRLRYLDDHAWTQDIVVVSHGAAIRLAAATLAGIDAGFAVDHQLGNAEPVVLAPITDGRWSCVQWGALTPPFYPEPITTPVADAVESRVDPMG